MGIDEKLGIETIKTDIQLLKNEIRNRRERYNKEIEKGTKTIPYDLKIDDPDLIFKNPPGNKLKAKCHAGLKIISKEIPEAYIVGKGTSRLKLNKVHVKKDWTKTKDGGVVAVTANLNNKL
ncbi:hypothetical protein ENBRE01_2595 [Enteropsectra breve]|nr:hypothetical protein ENBRE01_2595 [Enteropsectra breve]